MMEAVQEHQGHDEHEHGPEVTIEVNDESYRIHRGRRTVVEIKTAGGVPLAHDLEQLVEGRLQPLPDDGSVVIKGSEEFFSHPKDSGSS